MVVDEDQGKVFIRGLETSSLFSNSDASPPKKIAPTWFRGPDQLYGNGSTDMLPSSLEEDSVGDTASVRMTSC